MNPREISKHVRPRSNKVNQIMVAGLKLVFNQDGHQPIREQTMLKKLSILFIVAGTLCRLAFNLIGATIDAQGVLHEPFALLPIGFLLIALGALSYIYHLVKNKLGSGKR